MITREIFIENPYDAVLVAEPVKDGKTKRRERRKKKVKNKFGI